MTLDQASLPEPAIIKQTYFANSKAEITYEVHKDNSQDLQQNMTVKIEKSPLCLESQTSENDQPAWPAKQLKEE